VDNYGGRNLTSTEHFGIFSIPAIAARIKKNRPDAASQSATGAAGALSRVITSRRFGAQHYV
jgi:hypothetical protein